MRTRRAGDRRGRRLLGVAVLSVAAPLIAVAGALALTTKTVVITDAKEDLAGALDIQRASLGLGTDGRLRAVVTFAGEITPKAMLATSGPPGSVCVRVWTAAQADPASMRPDRLICVTARSEDELRAGVFEQQGPVLPKRIADASVRANASGRSLIVRAAQSALGMPKSIRFAFESTRPGCERAICIDTAPDGGVARRLRLR